MEDLDHMRLAVELAKRGTGWTAPNPLVGAVLVESVFAMGGLGDLLIKGIKAADYPVVQGVTLLMVFVFLCINLVVDILYAVLDPRIRMK